MNLRVILFYTMNLQADEFATVDLSPEKSSVNKGTKRPITSPRGGFKGFTSAPIILSLFTNLQIVNSRPLRQVAVVFLLGWGGKKSGYVGFFHLC